MRAVAKEAKETTHLFWKEFFEDPSQWTQNKVSITHATNAAHVYTHIQMPQREENNRVSVCV